MDLLIRADGNSEIGWGHVVRMVALAEAAQLSGWNVTFRSHKLSKTLEKMIRSRDIRLEIDDDHDDNLSELSIFQCVVVDGYHLTDWALKVQKKSNVKVLYVDDYRHTDDYPFDAILNQNPVNDSFYDDYANPETVTLTGPDYWLLRKEIREIDGDPSLRPPINVLISLGGGNHDESIISILEIILNFDYDDLLLKPLVDDPDYLQERFTTDQLSPIKKSDSLISELRSIDLAITAAGSITGELAYLGIPFVLFELTENQHYVAQGWERLNLATNLGSFDDLDQQNLIHELEILLRDTNEFEQRSNRGKTLIDGMGSRRVLDKVKELSPSQRL